jgi:apolipoprotein N-acyltransferase
VLPEKIDDNEPAAAERRAALEETARRNAVYLVVGIGLTDEGRWKNRAWFFGPAGELLGEYDKQHLVPGWESAMTAGREDLVRSLDGYRFGVAICKDMHFASLGRSYGKAGVTAMLEPAWDFERDAWMAARVAAFRGVENGYSVVHAARQSVLSASDRYGRFVAETPSSPLPGAAVIAQVPMEARSPTLYARFGDWFGWLCVAVAALLRFLPRSSGGMAPDV